MMARTVGELPISDQYAVVPASTRLNEAIDLMSKPTVEILLVEDPEVKRIVGVLTEQHILRILASGADASRTKVATHMLPNKKSVRGILRLTPDAPVADAKQFILDQNPVAVIVESMGALAQAKGKGVRGSTQSQLHGFISPADVRNVSVFDAPSHGRPENTGGLRMPLPIPDPEIRTPEIMRPSLSRSPEQRVERLSVPIAEQLMQVASHYLAEHGPMKQPGSKRPNGRDWMVCSSSTSGGVTAVWPISAGDVAVHGQDVPLYVCAWMNSPSVAPPEAWRIGVAESLAGRPAPKATAILVDVMNDRRPRFDTMGPVALGVGKDAADGAAVTVDLSRMSGYDSTRHRILICAHA